MPAKYTTVTETPGIMASKEQLMRLFQRYHFAYQFCKEKYVLEVACGAGQGLGYLAKDAKMVVGGDIDENNLKFAREQYQGRHNVKLGIIDAQKMPFENNSFDIVILYEAIYYLSNPGEFISEAHRILKNDGLLILCSANKDWADFNPSPFSQKYFSVPELCYMLKQKFTTIDFYGGFSTCAKGPNDAIVSLIKRMAVSLHLVPKTMKGKEFFKRLFFGNLYPLPAEIIDGMAEYSRPAPIASHLADRLHKVIFAVAHKK